MQTIFFNFLGSNIHLDSLYKSGDFGVVTGWGPRPEGSGSSESLKQLQIKIQEDDKCRNSIDKANLNLTYMFCAGSKSKSMSGDHSESKQ